MVNSRKSNLVLITGATGFLARYLIPLLRKEGHYVVGIARRKVCDIVMDEYHAIDLLDRSLTAAFIKRISPDLVIHLAGISFVNHAKVNELKTVNVVATDNLLSALKMHQPQKIQAVLLASSAIVYGHNAVGCINEWTEPKPKNDYGKSKLEMERLAKDFVNDFPIVVMRFFNFIGPDQAEIFLIPKLVKHYLNRENMIPLGNMDVSRDFSDVRDTCAAVAKLLSLYCEQDKDAKRSKRVSVYNVSNGRATPLKEILSLLTNLTQHNPEFLVRSELLRENEIMSLWGDNSKLIQTTGHTVQYSLEETLTWMLNSDQSDK